MNIASIFVGKIPLFLYTDGVVYFIEGLNHDTNSQVSRW
ncbi:hypothetical protein BDE27_2672 [Xenorhabdus ehlersii]|uniref:Uncharacterized protein n=1 Tax=Xenorhabdus ehlersii TaxID=290111 RepID=A0A2D0INZ8_9GAMM|nr:hypothetical protein [Xenorhabdus sp. TS4]PHM23548.1 hypothetical protein Xehl_02823 [Xenorhabdus ehlersii]RKE90769.1 hypothetical protein BDE27_2672 [Xenorhabdus ehlersii]